MQITNITKGKILLGTMLMLVIAQLFSIHLHFEHVEQTHDVHFHSTLMPNHDLIDDVASEHGEEGGFDLVGSSGKKLSAFYLLTIFCYVLILPCLLQRRLRTVDIDCLHWQHRYFFFPRLRAPPLYS